jgi:periplasmic protein TonB
VQHGERIPDVPLAPANEPIAPVPVAPERARTPEPRGAPGEPPARTAATSASGGGAGPSTHDIPGETMGSGANGQGAGSQTAALGTVPGGGDSPSAGYGQYLAGVRSQIAESLHYPLAARRRRLTGTVQLEIVIQANGAIGAADVVQSSSHAILDEAALDTVRGLRPMPFPPEVPPRRLRVRLPVIFTLE